MAHIARHQFTNTFKIRAGKTANLVAYSGSPPTRILEAKEVGKKSLPRYLERVVINRIEYDDDSFWQ